MYARMYELYTVETITSKYYPYLNYEEVETAGVGTLGTTMYPIVSIMDADNANPQTWGDMAAHNTVQVSPSG